MTSNPHPPNPPSRRTSRGLSVILAHDPRSRACDLFASRVLEAAGALRGAASLEEIGSLEAAWVALDRARWAREDTLVLACLDLPPVPRAGVTVLSWARSLRLPVIAVTHGRRWLPPGGDVAFALSPLAGAAEIARAVASVAGRTEDVYDVGCDPPPESFPGRPSWLG